MALYLSILTVVLLALVAGLLITLYFQLREWRSAAADAPLLAEKLTEAIMSARKGLAALRADLVAHGPELMKISGEASKLRTELQFLLQRGAKLADELDEREAEARADMPMLRLAPTTQAVVEQVAVANGLAAKPVKEAADGDPLEELLANLQTQPAETVKKSPKRKRSGPVTQAELDLQQSLASGGKGAGR